MFKFWMVSPYCKLKPLTSQTLRSVLMSDTPYPSPCNIGNWGPYCLQAYVIEKGPVFLAMWTPLGLVITMACSTFFLGEIISLGR